MRKNIFYRLWNFYKSEHPHFLYVNKDTYFKYRGLYRIFFILTMILNKNYIQCEIFKKRHKHLRNIVVIGLKWNGRNVKRRTNGFAKRFIKTHRNSACLYCGVNLTNENSTTDHVIPIAKGGNNTKVNFIVCCENCNGERGEQDFNEYLRIKNKEFINIKYPFI